MSRLLRHAPGGAPVLVSCRLAGDRPRLVPDSQLDGQFATVLAQATNAYPVDVHAWRCLPDGYEMLMTPSSAGAQAQFMAVVNRDLSIAIARARGWSGAVWHGRYKSTAVSAEPQVQMDLLGRLVQVGEDGRRSRCLDALIGNSEIVADARRTRQERDADRRATVRTSIPPLRAIGLRLAVLPAWAAQAPEAVRQAVLGLVAKAAEPGGARSRIVAQAIAIDVPSPATQVSFANRPVSSSTTARHAKPPQAGQRDPGTVQVSRTANKIATCITVHVFAGTQAIAAAMAATYRAFVVAWHRAAAKLRRLPPTVQFPRHGYPCRHPSAT